MKLCKLSKLTGTALLLISTLIWGSSFVVSKNVIGAIPPGWLVAFRFLIAGATLVALFPRKLKLLDRSYLLRGLLLSLLYSAGMLLQTYGVLHTTPGKSAFLTSAYCVIVPFVAWLMMKKRPRMRNLLAAAVAIIGIALVSLTERFTVEKGDYLVLLCSVVFSFHIVYLSICVESRDATLLVMLQFIISGVFALVFALCFEPVPVVSSTAVSLGVLYLGVFCTAAAMLGQSLAQRVLSPSTVSLLLCFEAVFGAVFSALFYGETFTVRILAGFVLIIAAVFVSEWPAKSARQTV